ncbi:hypothetical protein [Shewanella psychropiezotolerans]|nr:hypothetical protein [Shewanella psychropiezotolerans]
MNYLLAGQYKDDDRGRGMSKFRTQQGTVVLSAPFASIDHDNKQIEIKYTPNNYYGWRICRNYDAGDVSHFTQPDAEAFALLTESKLRTPYATTPQIKTDLL